MAGSANIFGNFFVQVCTTSFNYSTDSIKLMLLTSSYAPNLATHVHYSDVSAYEVAATGGYTTGGVALASKTCSFAAASSFATTWASGTYAVGTVVRPTTANGFLYSCSVAGTTASTQPTWLTSGEYVGHDYTDGSVTWTCVGESITQWGSTAVSWASATITASYGIVYDAQSGTASTEPLLFLVNFGGSQASTNGTFSVTPSTIGGALTWAWVCPA